MEAAPFILPEPLRQARGSVVRGNIPHNLAEVDWSAGGTKKAAMEHGARVALAWAQLLIREVEKMVRGHGEFPAKLDSQQAHLPHHDH
eukprot:5748618-Pleurochrysis_carterae.AAC.1